MSKTLGQINEDAFLEKWHTIPDDTKVGVGRLICFEAAAEAVEDELAKPFPENATYKAEYAVIEAARAAKDSIYYAQGHAEKLGIEWPGLEELLSALKALDSEEG